MLTIREVTHLNHVVPDLGQAIEVYRHVLDAEPFHHGSVPQQGQEHSLLMISDCYVELFGRITEPNSLDSFIRRYGGGWHSLQWRVDSLETSIEQLRAVGVRVLNYHPTRFFFSHPADTHGMMFEFRETPLDPENLVCQPAVRPELATNNPGRPQRLASYWSRPGSMGILGLDSITFHVRDIGTAADFLCAHFGGVHEGGEGGGTSGGTRIRIADTRLELLCRRGERTDTPAMHSVNFDVTELGVVHEYLERLGVRHCLDEEHNVLVLDDEIFGGARFHFIQQRPHVP